ncbi:MAG TPA: Uma2 family endonuclease [Bauldia sp.]|nr:Uma2 family endonuclease [Bauldia sp.]
MGSSGKKPATYADLEAAPPHLVAEIIDGELLTHPRPSPRHAASAASLTEAIAGPFQKGRGGPGGWVFFAEPELRLGPHFVVPDVAGWRRARLSGYPETNYFELAPDWVCEVLSVATERHDRGGKRRIYAEAGVGHLWLIDPRFQLLEAFALSDGRWSLVGTWQADEIANVPPFEAIALPLADLWPLDPPLGFHESPQHLFAGDR